MTDWVVRNARELQWTENDMGSYCDLLQGQGDGREEFAINLNVLPKGAPMAIYHHEPHQEGFLILRGACVAIIDGEEVALSEWDYFHCPPNVAHVVVGASDEPALVLAVGSRVGGGDATYPPEPLAARYRASTTEEMDVAAAYAQFGEHRQGSPPL
jgi:quercetin dioxygenase-like cupin family protein